MQAANRDLLVLTSVARLTPEERDKQVANLHSILYLTENWEAFCTAHEILDLNRLKTITKPHLMQKLLSEPRQKAFVFLNNKN